MRATLHCVKTLELLVVVERAVDLGLAAAAVADNFGSTLAVAGALAADEVRLIVGTVTHRLNSEALMGRMSYGKMVEVSVKDRIVGVGIAARFVFVVAVFPTVTRSSRAAASSLRREVELLLLDERPTDLVVAPPWTKGGGGSSSGPANLPVIEYGLTVARRERAKA
jgi:hypothetical protein